MEFLFFILMILIFGKILMFGIKATWGFLKVLVYIVFLPLILVLMFLGGLIYIAFPILIVVGILSLIAGVE